MKVNKADVIIASGITLAALIVYIRTLTPSLSYLSPDGNELATVPYVLGLAHSPGYPVYTWLGYLFSHILTIGDVAYRINMMSAILGALGVCSVYWISLRVLSKSPSWASRCSAALSALLFAFSVDFWLQALIAEVYAPNIALVALSILMLLIWEHKRNLITYFLFTLSFGLSLGTHLSNLGFGAAFVLFTLLTIFTASQNDENNLKENQKKITNKLLEVVKVGIAGIFGFVLGAGQFLWLPLSASTLNDRTMLRNAPTSIAALYKYTLGAFPNFKFAFPLEALPDRLVIYLDLLQQQYGLIGILLGIAGLFILLFRRPRHYFLLVGMYLVNIWFFIQYNAFDLEVFFIPAHFIWAIFMAFGVWGLVTAVQSLGSRLASFGRLNSLVGRTCLVILVFLTSLLPIKNNWQHNNLSSDTAINDFYANMWEILPGNAALITPSGVFGYDAFYWQLAYNTRPDVLLPMLPTPDPSPDSLSGREVYATTQALQGNRGPGALPPGFLNNNPWQIPILLGEQPSASSGRRGALVLYQLSDQPPQLTTSHPNPQIILQAQVGEVVLLGIDLASDTVESGGYIQLTLYWDIDSTRPVRIETRLGDRSLEQHEIGFGLLQRYINTLQPDRDEVVVEKYALVIPSTIPAGETLFTLSTIGLQGERGRTINLAVINVVNEMEAIERWLQIAGSS